MLTSSNKLKSVLLILWFVPILKCKATSIFIVIYTYHRLCHFITGVHEKGAVEVTNSLCIPHNESEDEVCFIILLIIYQYL